MSKHKANENHELFYQEFIALLGKHAGHLSAPELLAIASNCVGKLIAYQDARTMTEERAMEIVIKNIEMGNSEAMPKAN